MPDDKPYDWGAHSESGSVRRGRTPPPPDENHQLGGYRNPPPPPDSGGISRQGFDPGALLGMTVLVLAGLMVWLGVLCAWLR